MKIFVTGAVVLAGLTLAVPAQAAPGQCSVTGYDSFACDVTVDGGGIAFGLPDGQTFVFSQIADGAGLAYLIPAEAVPGTYPRELGAFSPAPDEDGCWLGEKDDVKFCAALAQ